MPAYTYAPPLAALAAQPPPSLCSQSDPPIAHLMTSVLLLRQQQQQQPASQKTESSSNSSSSNTKEAQVLLLRRSPTDSYPLKWEMPGGSVDASDKSVLDAAARELWEESGLEGAHFHASVGMTTQDVREAQELLRGTWGIQPHEEDAKDVQVQVQVDDAAGVVVKITTFLETAEVWGKLNFVATMAEDGAVVVMDPAEHVEWGWFTEDEVRTGRAGDKVLAFTSQAVWGSILEGFRVGRAMGVVE